MQYDNLQAIRPYSGDKDRISRPIQKSRNVALQDVTPSFLGIKREVREDAASFSYDCREMKALGKPGVSVAALAGRVRLIVKATDVMYNETGALLFMAW